MLNNEKLREHYKEIPDNLFNKSKSLTSLGVYSVCWSYADAIEVINFLYENNFAILGGDVISFSENKFKYTYDNWSVDRKKLETDKMYLERSKNESLNYIEDYIYQKGTDFYFVVVYKKL